MSMLDGHPSNTHACRIDWGAWVRAVQKTIFSRNQYFQVILLITHKSKTIGTIAAAF